MELRGLLETINDDKMLILSQLADFLVEKSDWIIAGMVECTIFGIKTLTTFSLMEKYQCFGARY